MSMVRRGLTAAALVATTLIGGAIGAVLINGTAASAQTSVAPSPPSAGSGAAANNGGTFKPNEDPAHEAGESAQREAQENAGQRPTVP
ncbi:MAG: hypothetical protein JWR88_1362 [Pseudonocardia sp.]|jgi:hypothetical protein|nr:hypothetical protein [Pseudonocardia sp.]